MQPKILVVDDEEIVRKVSCGLLEHAGFQACPAENYQQAIALLDASIDLALLDVHLEGESGLDILGYIREHYPDCPVVMVSGDADKENTITALRQGAVEYLDKPVQPEKLIDTIKHWVDFSSLQQGNPRLKGFQEMHQLSYHLICDFLEQHFVEA